jgi:hypothetical protein
VPGVWRTSSRRPCSASAPRWSPTLGAMSLKRPEFVAEDQLAVMARTGVARFEAAGSTILVGDTAWAVVAAVDDSPSHSCVWNALEFCLRNGGQSLLGDVSRSVLTNLLAHLLVNATGALGIMVAVDG